MTLTDAVLDLVERHGDYLDLAAALCRELKLPFQPNELTSRLKSVSHLLERRGVRVEVLKHSRVGTRVRLTRIL